MNFWGRVLPGEALELTLGLPLDVLGKPGDMLAIPIRGTARQPDIHWDKCAPTRAKCLASVCTLLVPRRAAQVVLACLLMAQDSTTMREAACSQQVREARLGAVPCLQSVFLVTLLIVRKLFRRQLSVQLHVDPFACQDQQCMCGLALGPVCCACALALLTLARGVSGSLATVLASDKACWFIPVTRNICCETDCSLWSIHRNVCAEPDSGMQGGAAAGPVSSSRTS